MQNIRYTGGSKQYTYAVLSPCLCRIMSGWWYHKKIHYCPEHGSEALKCGIGWMASRSFNCWRRSFLCTTAGLQPMWRCSLTNASINKMFFFVTKTVFGSIHYFESDETDVKLKKNHTNYFSLTTQLLTA